jgi:hypothetical protein
MTIPQIIIIAAFAGVGLAAFIGLMIHATKLDLQDDCPVCHHPLPPRIHGLCDRCAKAYLRNATGPGCRAYRQAGAPAADPDWAERAAAAVIQDRRIAWKSLPYRP